MTGLFLGERSDARWLRPAFWALLVLTAVLSCLNSGLYTASRMLWVMKIAVLCTSSQSCARAMFISSRVIVSARKMEEYGIDPDLPELSPVEAQPRPDARPFRRRHGRR